MATEEHGLKTELCLGLPGDDSVKVVTLKRGFSETVDLKLKLHESSSHVEKSCAASNKSKDSIKPPHKAQVVGWPPVRSFRRNAILADHQKSKNDEDSTKASDKATFVKVSMDGAPYLRKVDLKTHKSYQELSSALGKLFSSFTIGDYGSEGMIDFMNESKVMDVLNSSEYVATYEDRDGDWMLLGDVPWEMFVDSCKRIRIMKGCEAIGLAPRAIEKCKNRS